MAVDEESCHRSGTVMNPETCGSTNQPIPLKRADSIIDLSNNDAEVTMGMRSGGLKVEPDLRVDGKGETQGEASPIEVNNGKAVFEDGLRNGIEDAASGVQRRVDDGSEDGATIGKKRSRTSDKSDEQPAVRQSKRVKTEPIEAAIPNGQGPLVSKFNPRS